LAQAISTQVWSRYPWVTSFFSMARFSWMVAMSIGYVCAEDSHNSSVQEQCPDFEAQGWDTDMEGDLLAEEWAASSDGCCSSCGKKEGCEGFAYRDNKCYLKTNFTRTYSNAGVITRLRKGLGANVQGFGASQQGKDLSGDLLDDWYAPHADVCVVGCAAKPACQGIAFIDNRCYLKGNVGGTYKHQGCSARLREDVIVQCPAGFGAPANDMDLAGDLLAAEWAATSDGCCSMCHERDGCEGFAFFQHVCYLKANFSGTVAKIGATSRIRSDLGGGCPGFKAAEQNKDLAGDLLDQWYATRPESCCVACGRRPDCQGFAFAKDRCYLKGNVKSTYDQEGCLVHLKSSDRRLTNELDWLV